MFDQNRGRKSRLVMQATTAIRMTASSYLEVKRAVHFIFFRSVNASQVFRHFEKYVRSSKKQEAPESLAWPSSAEPK
jgi:hypothetical protein